ncbi:MAG TPA: nucleotidyltransferase family protein [Candidatus Angelobacter sp.]|jgi:NDP-sugar pyrophosphorylase family protein|nr:nucleotidyltransferase family protein [Candidatus Angelobacter sp.]
MKAMVLAAGLGTRLRPLTNDRPKALVEVGGRSLLEITLTRLRDFGINDVIVNVHHYADMVIDHVMAAGSFGMHIEFSREDVLLDTGGGLKKAAWFLSESADANDEDEPFILHNVDIISNIDLSRLVESHKKNNALATLAVQERKTSRYLMFDEQLQLCGRRLVKEEKTEIVRPSQRMTELAFTGIHVISQRIFPLLTEEGVFSIVPAYLRLAALGEKIQSFRADEYYWRDLGKPENICQAEQDIKANLVR